MTEPMETMRQMLQLSKVLGGLPGVDEEDINGTAAKKMRKTFAESLCAVTDDCNEGEMYELIKDAEDEMLAEDNIDTGDMPKGQARMMCQIALVKHLVEGE